MVWGTPFKRSKGTWKKHTDPVAPRMFSRKIIRASMTRSPSGCSRTSDGITYMGNYNNVLLVKIEGPVWHTIYDHLPVVKGVCYTPLLINQPMGKGHLWYGWLWLVPLWYVSHQLSWVKYGNKLKVSINGNNSKYSPWLGMVDGIVMG